MGPNRAPDQWFNLDQCREISILYGSGLKRNKTGFKGREWEGRIEVEQVEGTKKKTRVNYDRYKIRTKLRKS